MLYNNKHIKIKRIRKMLSILLIWSHKTINLSYGFAIAAAIIVIAQKTRLSI